MNHSISVIIPSYNSSSTIEYTLKGLLDQSPVKADEIIVVDSSDNDKFYAIVSKYQTLTSVKFIRSMERLTPAQARNIGARRASGNLLVFLDSDVVPSPSLLSIYMDAYQTGCQAGGGSVELSDFQASMFIPSAQYYLQCNEYIPAGKKRIKKFLSGCNFFCDSGLFKNVGGFPDLRASEDVLLGLNLSNITKIWFIPSASVSHVFREGLKGYLSNQRLLGRHIGIYRKMISKFFISNKILLILLFPLFFIVKHLLIILRVYLAGYSHIFRFIKVFPMFSFGVFFWTLGFVTGSMEGNE
jgi:glycosyltransferase involved in cell wall biosynthesis